MSDDVPQLVNPGGTDSVNAANDFIVGRLCCHAVTTATGRRQSAVFSLAGLLKDAKNIVVAEQEHLLIGDGDGVAAKLGKQNFVAHLDIHSQSGAILHLEPRTHSHNLRNKRASRASGEPSAELNGCVARRASRAMAHTHLALVDLLYVGAGQEHTARSLRDGIKALDQDAVAQGNQLAKTRLAARRGGVG